MMKKILGRVRNRLIENEFVSNVLITQRAAQKMLGKKNLLRFMPKPELIGDSVLTSGDPVRMAMISLAIHRLESEGVAGSFAELGVFRGETSKFIHHFAPHRKFFLFDTFKGFDTRDDAEANADTRFLDTSAQKVRQHIASTMPPERLIFREGYFPETAAGLEQERFAFVMLDVDKYAPTLAGLEFFYPRLLSGGYIFIHDFNSPESDWGVSKAVNLYMQGKPEKLVDIPDAWGSVLLRKI
ncbi:MAG: class I SAM-dependent methyltransferase [Rhizobacter sp.]|nr:class I SAM-dependent methyltransferase [Chlorobiales bacterium]